MCKIVFSLPVLRLPFLRHFIKQRVEPTACSVLHNTTDTVHLTPAVFCRPSNCVNLQWRPSCVCCVQPPLPLTCQLHPFTWRSWSCRDQPPAGGVVAALTVGQCETPTGAVRCWQDAPLAAGEFMWTLWQNAGFKSQSSHPRPRVTMALF